MPAGRHSACANITRVLNNAELSKLGVAVINFPNGDVEEQKNADSRGKGNFINSTARTTLPAQRWPGPGASAV